MTLGTSSFSHVPSSAPAYRDAIRGFYDESAASVARHLDRGLTVAVLSEGDPLFYGSAMYLLARLAAEKNVKEGKSTGVSQLRPPGI